MSSYETLKKNIDFQKVYKSGKSYANKYLVMYVLENGTDITRIGISVSKKVGNSIVRHRLTRLIREACRLNYNSIRTGYDIVIISRAAHKGKGNVQICPNMKKISLDKVIASLENEETQVEMDAELIHEAHAPMKRMLELSK